MIEGTDYEFVYPEDDKEAAHIRVLSGKYNGTLFKYGKVKFNPEEPNRLQFAYYVLESSVMKPKKLEKDNGFKQYAGDLLVHIITLNVVEEFEGDITDDNEPRENNPEVSDLQRGVL